MATLEEEARRNVEEIENVTTAKNVEVLGGQ